MLNRSGHMKTFSKGTSRFSTTRCRTDWTCLPRSRATTIAWVITRRDLQGGPVLSARIDQRDGLAPDAQPSRPDGSVPRGAGKSALALSHDPRCRYERKGLDLDDDRDGAPGGRK